MHLSDRSRAAETGLIAAMFLLCLSGPTRAAPDCRHPKARLDRMICATPALKDQEAALDKALAEALGRNPGRAAETQAGQRTWLADREAACATPNRGALERCLDAQYRFRLQMLAAIPAGATPAAPPPTGSAPAATQDSDSLDPGAYMAEAVTLRLNSDASFDLREIGGSRQAGGRYAYKAGILTFSDGQGDIGKTQFPLQCRVLRTAAGFAVLLGQANCHPFDGLSFRKAD